MEILLYFLVLTALAFIVFYLKDCGSSKRIKIVRHLSKPSSFYYFKPQKPVKWFDFSGLMTTFRMVSLSSDILSVIDKREVQTALGKDSGNELINNDIQASPDEFWFDFIADTGDGFDSTTTLFYHLSRVSYAYALESGQAQNSENKSGIVLKRGSVLVIGGDLVYPAGSEANYRNRFKGPLRFVAPNTGKPGPLLIATPGNHDWYDGLSAFFRLMCQQKKIGDYKTVQNRSYFAYVLRKNVHLFGVDNQLLGDIDIPQMAFFIDYVKRISEKNAKNHVILLIAEPYWYSYDTQDRYKRRQRMDSLEYMIRTLTATVKGMKACNVESEIIFEVVVTGDIHHYSHYALDEDNTDYGKGIKHFITSGGGGAFGHVTDFLKEKITIPLLQDSTAEECYHLNGFYPSMQKSRAKTWWSIIFFIINYEFTALMLFLSLSVTYIRYSSGSIVKDLILFLFPAVFWVVITKITNTECSVKEKWTACILRFLLSACSFVLQWFILVKFPAYKFSFLYDEHLQPVYINEIKNFLSIPESAGYFVSQWILSGILQSLLFGWYIFFGYRFFRLYITEISSAKVNIGDKNFLKFKVTDHEIVIYVIAVKKVYKWMKLLKRKKAYDVQNEMCTKDPKEFIKDNFHPNPDHNINIIDTITIKL